MYLNFLAELVATNVTSHSGTDVVVLPSAAHFQNCTDFLFVFESADYVMQQTEFFQHTRQISGRAI